LFSFLEIDYREKLNVHQNDIENEFHFLTEHDRRVNSECQLYSEEYSTNELDKELEYKKNLHSNYEHLQQQLTRCSSTLEQNRQLQEQIQSNIEKTHKDIEQIQTNIDNDKKVRNSFASYRMTRKSTDR
jgi:archaellum component FlaC